VAILSHSACRRCEAAVDHLEAESGAEAEEVCAVQLHSIWRNLCRFALGLACPGEGERPYWLKRATILAKHRRLPRRLRAVVLALRIALLRVGCAEVDSCHRSYTQAGQRDGQQQRKRAAADPAARQSRRTHGAFGRRAAAAVSPAAWADSCLERRRCLGSAFASRVGL